MFNTEILDYLYSHYYLSDQTPDHLISSHWKHYQKEIKVKLERHEIKSLIGVAFGDLQHHDSVSQFFSWATILSYLIQLPNRAKLTRLLNLASNVTKRMGLALTYDCFRQTCSLELVQRFFKLKVGRPKVLLIGDGYGFLASLIKDIYPSAQITLIDLGKVLLFQAYFCNKAHPDSTHFLVTPSTIPESDFSFIYCPTELLANINSFNFNLAINIASMQEMNQETVRYYFNYLRQHLTTDGLFYCCNRERKVMPAGEISEFLQYPWAEEDKHLIDEYCAWYRYFLSFTKAQYGPKLMNLRIPFVNYFDGAVRHRLSILDTKAADNWLPISN